MPVVSDLLEAHSLADVDQVEDVLLEAGASKAHARIEELGPDARVCANAECHLQTTMMSRCTGSSCGLPATAQLTELLETQSCH